MDPVRNPYGPGAGTPPPELTGRSDILKNAEIALQRKRAGRPERSLVLVGLCGVGKTVLLNRTLNYQTAMIEVSQDKSLPQTLVPELRSILFHLDALHGLSEKVKRALRVLRRYAERLFDFPNVGPLSQEETQDAIQLPAQREGAEFSSQALRNIQKTTKGYPYFVQEWAYQAWNAAAKAPVTLGDVHRATALAIQRLEESFFRVRFDRLPQTEKKYLRAMAELGPGPHRSSDIAAAYGAALTSVAPMRANLISQGMIYSPAHGDAAFTVPLFDEFMRRTMPYDRTQEIEVRVHTRTREYEGW